MPERYSDQDLIKAVCAYSAEAARVFISRYRPLVAGLAVGRFNYSRMQVDDLFNQIIAQLWERDFHVLKAWRGRGRFSTYLTVIVLHLCQKQIRLAARERPLDDAWLAQRESAQPRPEENAAGEQSGRHVRRALAGLSERDRLLIRLRYYDEYSPREMGQLLGLSGGAVRKALFDAVRRLRRRYQELESEQITP